jgi:cysteinyl-tRNA synthetase
MKRWLTIAAAVALAGLVCSGCPLLYQQLPGVEFRENMRSFVEVLSAYGKGPSSNFVILQRGGGALLTDRGALDDDLSSTYIQALDGILMEDVFYGYEKDDELTPALERDAMMGYLRLAETNGIEGLVIDHCAEEENILLSFAYSKREGFVSFQADRRELDNIPALPKSPFETNKNDIATLADVRNFLCILRPGTYLNRWLFVNALAKTQNDLLIIDPAFQDEAITALDVSQLKEKPQDGKRLVLAYLNIGEADRSRPYWQAEWTPGNPAWLDAEIPDKPGHYRVLYWELDWQDIVYEAIDDIVKTGFDGVYLDLSDAYEYYEEHGLPQSAEGESEGE